MNLEQARQYLDRNGIELILAQFVDIHGAAKTKAVPAAHLDMIVQDGAGFAGFAVWGMGMGPHGPDFMARGDLSTLTKIGWMPKFGRIACTGHVNGKPYEYDSRFVCQRALDRVQEELGCIAQTGLEPEFFLLRRNPETGMVEPADSGDRLEKPCYDYGGLSRTSAVLAQLTEMLIECGMDVYQIDHEDANGQYEINFTYEDALRTADNYILFKMAASTIAHEHGMICSFMPKPMQDRTGNGMHIHLSFSRDGTNVFADPEDPRGLGISSLAYQFIGGLFAHAPALTSLTSPSVNSYKRLVGQGSRSGATWAPTSICYGENNRTAMVRTCGDHIEFRSGDSSANPYLMTAAVLAAGLDGIKRGLDPGEPVNLNLYELTSSDREKLGIRTLPQNLLESIVALREDDVIRDGIGQALAEEFIMLKTEEWNEYHRHVSDWEINRYLEFY